ncbi:hypothetical protein BJY00DRAFT_197468 [Aspergillus carlsbadensis]|nr:hypothetical protein BJY00DRAFT_197468 [Aspergillus carlsbadensis]
MKCQPREEAEYQSTPLDSMDETQPLAPAHRNNPHDTPQPGLGNRLRTLASRALGTSPDTGSQYKAIGYPVVLSWVCSAAVLGLCAFIVARAGPGWLRSVAIVNMILAAAGVLVTLGLDVRFPISRSQSDPRPSVGSYVYILAKGAIWTLAAAAIFASSTTYERSSSSFTKRKGSGGRGGGGGGSIGPATPDSVAIGAGFMDCLVVVSTLFYWKFPIIALVKRYSEQETRRMYSLMLAPSTRDVEGGK